MTNKDLVLFKTLEGKNLENLSYLSPISKDECPILTADYVTRETGTGLVHTAPGHGIDDYTTGAVSYTHLRAPRDRG